MSKSPTTHKSNCRAILLPTPCLQHRILEACGHLASGACSCSLHGYTGTQPLNYVNPLPFSRTGVFWGLNEGLTSGSPPLRPSNLDCGGQNSCRLPSKHDLRGWPRWGEGQSSKLCHLRADNCTKDQDAALSHILANWVCDARLAGSLTIRLYTSLCNVDSVQGLMECLHTWPGIPEDPQAEDALFAWTAQNTDRGFDCRRLHFICQSCDRTKVPLGTSKQQAHLPALVHLHIACSRHFWRRWRIWREEQAHVTCMRDLYCGLLR